MAILNFQCPGVMRITITTRISHLVNRTIQFEDELRPNPRVRFEEVRRPADEMLWIPLPGGGTFERGSHTIIHFTSWGHELTSSYFQATPHYDSEHALMFSRSFRFPDM